MLNGINCCRHYSEHKFIIASEDNSKVISVYRFGFMRTLIGLFVVLALASSILIAIIYGTHFSYQIIVVDSFTMEPVPDAKLIVDGVGVVDETNAEGIARFKLSHDVEREINMRIEKEGYSILEKTFPADGFRKLEAELSRNVFYDEIPLGPNDK